MLAIDDDEQIRRVYKRVLGSLFDARTADSIATAREMLDSGLRFDALILDLSMAGEDTESFWHWLRATHPEMAARTLVISGAPDDPHYKGIIDQRQGWVMHKPVGPWALRDRLWEVTDSQVGEHKVVGAR